MPRSFLLRYPAPTAASWTPLSIPSLLGWWDASDTATITGSPVSQWDDKSGNGHHFTQATGAKQPATGSTINLLNVITFDGTDDTMTSTAAFGVSGAVTMFVVAKNAAGSGQRDLLVLKPNDGRMFRTSAGNIDGYSGSFLDSGVAWGTSAAHKVGLLLNGASSKIQVDGALTSGTSGGAPSAETNLVVGSYHDGLSEFWQGPVCEIAVATGDQSASFASFDTYCSRWGI